MAGFGGEARKSAVDRTHAEAIGSRARFVRRSGLQLSIRLRWAVLRSEVMLFESDKVMFEIYREIEYTGKYRVVYFTELQDHNKETEINHALAGEHFFDGFIKNFKKDEAKEIISSLLNRLNNGEPVDALEV